MIITFIKFELHYYDVNQGVSTLPLLFRRWHTLPFVYQKSLFFYRAPAFNTCGVRYCFTNSVCLSVCLSNVGTVSKRMDKSSHFLTFIILVFSALPPLKKFQGNSLRWGVKCTGGIFFCKYCLLSRKRYEI